MSGTTKDTKRELPAGWRWVRLGEVCEVVGGSTPDTGNPIYWDGEIVWVTPTDLGKLSNATIYTTARRITSTGLQSCGTEMLPSGTVIMSSRAPIGHLAIAGVSLCTNQGCKSFIPSPKVDSTFLYWTLKQAVPNIQALGSGATFAEVSKSALQQFEIPLPPLDEQRRIAAILREQMTAVDAARAAAQARLEAIRALPVAYLRQVFPQPGASLPAGWRWIKLGDVASQGPDNGVFKRRENFGSGVPIVNVSDLYRSLYVNMKLTERVRVTENELMSFQIAPGDLFFCRSSLKREGIGWCCMVQEVDEPSVFECHVMRIRLKDNDAIPEYVAYYWQHPSVRENVIGNSRTATMTTMNQQDLAGVSIPLAPLSEQQRIAALLKDQMSAVDAARAAAEAELETINALPAALLRRAFNGEL